MATLSIRGVLEFYDGAVATECTHSNAINALLGEELGLGLMIHHLRASTGGDVAALADPCTQGTPAGVRLDRWVRVAGPGDAILYQVEVKNWCAHSLGGRPLAIEAEDATLAMHATTMWKRYWDAGAGCPVDKPLRKVLVPMRAPRHLIADRVEPVACVWDLLAPSGSPIPWFDVPAAGAFARLHWFSMSAYLRTLLGAGQSEIDIPTPLLDAGLAVVGRMVPAVFGGGATYSRLT